MRSEYFHHELLFIRFSTKYRVDWLPCEGFRSFTVAADYCGSVIVKNTAICDYSTMQTVVTDSCGNVPSKYRGFLLLYQAHRGGRLRWKRAEQIPRFLMTVPSKLWRPTTAEVYLVNRVFFYRVS